VAILSYGTELCLRAAGMRRIELFGFKDCAAHYIREAHKGHEGDRRSQIDSVIVVHLVHWKIIVLVNPLLCDPEQRCYDAGFTYPHIFARSCGIMRIHSPSSEAAVLDALLVPVIPKEKYSNVYFCNHRKLRARQNILTIVTKGTDPFRGWVSFIPP
jgi:hypothetical protein